MGKSQVVAQPVIDEINQKHPKVKVIFVSVDCGRFASVHKAADTIKKLDIPIDGLVGFPTLFAGPWAKTADGVESHFQHNYLSHFLLINLLLDLMLADSRVVMVSSCIRPEASLPEWDDPSFSVSVQVAF